VLAATPTLLEADFVVATNMSFARLMKRTSAWDVETAFPSFMRLPSSGARAFTADGRV